VLDCQVTKNEYVDSIKIIFLLPLDLFLPTPLRRVRHRPGGDARAVHSYTHIQIHALLAAPVPAHPPLMTHLRCRRSSEVRRMRFRACCEDVVEEEDEVEEDMVVVVFPLSSLPVRIMWWAWWTDPGGPPMI